MKKLSLLTALLTIFFAAYAYAGEVAQYKIIGISDDERYMAFGEYGITGKDKLFANIFIIDVAKNSFVSNGMIQKVYDVKTYVDQDGINALLYTAVENQKLLKSYNINLLSSGKLVYTLLFCTASECAEPPKNVAFTDFDTNIKYDVEMVQNSRTGKNNAPETAFSLNVAITRDGEQFSTVVGVPDYYRKNVKQYVLRSVYTTSTSGALIFIIEKHMTGESENDTSIYYMVETVTLPTP